MEIVQRRGTNEVGAARVSRSAGNGIRFGLESGAELATTPVPAKKNLWRIKKSCPVPARALRRRTEAEGAWRSEAQCGPSMVPRHRQAVRRKRSGAPCGCGAGFRRPCRRRGF